MGIDGKAKGRAFERELASALGGKRTPRSGASGGGDITLPTGSIWQDWSWEAKRRAVAPAILTGAFRQAESDLRIGDRRRPAVAFREDHGRAIVAFYLDDLVPWAESLAEVGNAGRVRRIAEQIEEAARELRKLTR